MIFWKGQLHTKLHHPYYAAALYRRILYQYPKSTLRSDAQLALADLYWHHMGKFNEAKELFYELINSSPQDEYGGNAQFYLSELMADSLHNQTEANRNYRLFCQNYPEHSFVALAWKRLGDAALKENNLLEARNYYTQSYERARENSLIVYVLQKMEDISFQLKDYKKAAVIMLIEAKHWNSAEKMFRAAELFEDKLNNTAESHRILHRLIENFPDSKFAKKAKEILNDEF